MGTQGLGRGWSFQKAPKLIPRVELITIKGQRYPMKIYPPVPRAEEPDWYRRVTPRLLRGRRAKLVDG